MPNQRDIAKVLGVNQATVSLALRGDRSISGAMIQRVREAAERLGYRPNAYVASLMAHIRAGRKPSEEGVIALLIEARSEADWYRTESYRIYHGGVLRRARELGFRVQSFFLKAPGMNAAVVDRILEARGIQGIIFAPPYRGNRFLEMRWERYACVGSGHGWEPQQFDRVANDHAQNVLLAYRELGRLGYRRIGPLFNDNAAVVANGLKWLPGYLEARHRLSAAERIPFFVLGNQKGLAGLFRRWISRNRPDVLLGITGWEKTLLETAGLRIPGDIGLACLVRPANSTFAGVDEKNEIIGATALELVASQIARNEYGIPAHPKLTLIDGRWVDGASAPGPGLAHRDEPKGGCLRRKPGPKKKSRLPDKKSR